MSMSIETILIVDTETQGLDPQKHRVLEIGAVWWSVRFRPSSRRGASFARRPTTRPSTSTASRPQPSPTA